MPPWRVEEHRKSTEENETPGLLHQPLQAVTGRTHEWASLATESVSNGGDDNVDNHHRCSEPSTVSFHALLISFGLHNNPMEQVLSPSHLIDEELAR